MLRSAAETLVDAEGAHGAARPSVLRVEGLQKSFHRGIWPWRRTVEVLKGTSLAVGASELVGLVGENGSGKSTLMQIVVGLLILVLRRAIGTAR